MSIPTSHAARRLMLASLLLGAPFLAAPGYAETDASTAIPSGSTLLAGARPPAGDFRVNVPFSLSQNTILLEARAGKKAPAERFIVDSGAPMTIAPSLAASLGLTPLATIGLAGPEGGHLTVPVTSIPVLTIGGITFSAVGTVVDWVEPPNPLACLSTAGLLGASLLQTAIWQIDFETGQITVTGSLSGLPGLEQAIKIPFQRSDAAGSPRFAVGVSDAENVSLLLDLGFNGSVAIPTDLLQRAGDHIPATAPTEEGQSSSTVFGQRASTTSIAMLRELRIGNLQLKNFPVITGTAVSDFHVGIEFLRHFRVTVDWVHNDLYLEPRDEPGALYSNFATYGFKPELRDGQLVVGAIWRGSAADRAGLALGDQLIAIDAHDTATADFNTLCAISDAIGLFSSNATPVTVTWVHSGQRKSSVIAKAPLLP